MQPKKRIPLERKVTFTDLEYLDRCEHLFEMYRDQPRQQTIRPPEQKAAMVAGNAFHRAASAHVSIRQAIIEEELSSLPVEKREEVRAEIDGMVKEADNSATTEDAGLRREVQLLWRDPVSGWTFASKPDLFGRGAVTRIKEDKRAKKFYDSHKFQVWFAAFVEAQNDLESKAHLPLEEQKLNEIEMTVRCSRFVDGPNGKERMWEKTFRFPVERLMRETALMRERIRLIERRERANYFVPKLEFNACNSCPRRAECKPLRRNGPLMAQLLAEEQRQGRPSVFEPASTALPVISPTPAESTMTSETA